MPNNYDCKIEVIVFENIWDRKNKYSYNNNNTKNFNSNFNQHYLYIFK